MRKIYNCTGHRLQIPNIVNTDGIYLFDEAGKRYMDMESGVWCTSLGHSNVRINKVIKKQIDSIMHAGFCYSNRILEALQSLKDSVNIIDVRGRGLMFAMDICNEKTGDRIYECPQ